MTSGLREQKRINTWRAIRAAAVELISERGFDSVSVEEIANAAGVAKRTFFNYFESKEAVLFDPDPGDPQRWQELAAARPPDEDPWISVREFLVEYTSGFAAKMAIQQRLLATSPGLGRRARTSGGLLRAFMAEWLSGRTGAGEAGQFRLTLMISTAFTILNTALTSWDPDSGFPAFQQLVRTGFSAVNFHTEE
jgi:AcrR family transcriptional regulator